MNSLVKAAVLGVFFCVCATAAIGTHALRQRKPPPAPHELYAVVNRQIAAFRTHDFPSAYQYAATGVQQKFTVAQFTAMVRRDYPELARVRGVEFGEVQVRGAAATVEVFFFLGDDAPRTVLYSLVAEGGEWKIAGAQATAGVRTARLSGTHA
jgi:hypothetical protein